MTTFLTSALGALLAIQMFFAPFAPAPVSQAPVVAAYEMPAYNQPAAAVLQEPFAVSNSLAAPVDTFGELGYTSVYSLNIEIDTSSMLSGAQLIIDALGGPYLYIAGLALGAAILGAIIAAVSRIRI